MTAITIRAMLPEDWTSAMFKELSTQDALHDLNIAMAGFTSAHLPALAWPQPPLTVLGAFSPEQASPSMLFFALPVWMQGSVRVVPHVLNAPPRVVLQNCVLALVDWAFREQGLRKLIALTSTPTLRQLLPLLRLNRHFLLEGRLRPPDVWVLSAFENSSLQPAPRRVQLPGQKRALRDNPMFAEWPQVPSMPLSIAVDISDAPWMMQLGAYNVRMLHARDASEPMVQWFQNADVQRGMNLKQVPQSLNALRALIAGFDQRRNLLIGLFETEQEKLVGLYSLHVDLAARTVHLALCMAPGLPDATQVMINTITPITNECFARYAVDKVTGTVLVSNRRMMLALLYNNTFVLEAHMRRECQTADLHWADVLILSTFRNPALRPSRGGLSPAEVAVGSSK